jgi:sec-independent protein translocase protein TatA
MSLGITEMLVILAIVLILFGAGKLPSVMGDLAKGIRTFKDGMKDEPSPSTPPAPTLSGPGAEAGRDTHRPAS